MAYFGIKEYVSISAMNAETPRERRFGADLEPAAGMPAAQMLSALLVGDPLCIAIQSICGPTLDHPLPTSGGHELLRLPAPSDRARSDEQVGTNAR
jgi:hypothetical protein